MILALCLIISLMAGCGDYCTGHYYDDGAGDAVWFYTTVHETETNFCTVHMFCYQDDVENVRNNIALWGSTFTESN